MFLSASACSWSLLSLKYSSSNYQQNLIHGVMMSSLFCDIAWHRLVAGYWRCGIIYCFQLQGSRVHGVLLELLDPWRWKKYIIPKYQWSPTSLHHTLRDDLNYTITEPWNLAEFIFKFDYFLLQHVAFLITDNLCT
jgi:hypothetical protein